MFKKMICNLKTFILVVGALLIGCEAAMIEVSEREFFIAKEWKITEYFKNDELMTNERAIIEEGGPIENYRLKLNDDFTYDRTFFNGSTDSGEWYLTAEGEYLNLNSEATDVPKKWRIITLEVRELELLLEAGVQGGRTDGIGELNARLILEPVKGQ